VGVLEARARDSATRMTALAAERDRAVVALKAELAQAGGPAQKTLGELKAWSEQLQSELTLVKKQLTAHRKSTAALDEAKASERAAGEAMEEHKAQLTVLQRQQAEGWEVQAAMERQLSHLRLFVEALLEPPAMAGSAATVALAEAQAGRKAAEADAAKARASVPGDAAAAKAATTAAAVAEQRLKAAGVALATANRHATEAATAHRNESEGYISEIEAISGVCEETQAQNARLLMQLAERDEYANLMVAERLTAIQAQNTMQEERAGQAAQVSRVGPSERNPFAPFSCVCQLGTTFQ